MGVAAAVVSFVLIVALVYVGLRALRSPEGRAAAMAPAVEGGLATVTLELGEVDPSSPHVQRLAHDAAARVFATRPDAEEVRVLAASGRLLATVARRAPGLREPSLPPWLAEPHAPHHPPGPSEALHARPPMPGVARGAPGDVLGGYRRLAELLELPEAVRRRLHDPDDPVDLVRAILEAGGLEVVADGDLLRAGGEAVVVLRAAVGEPVSSDALTHAYLRFVASGLGRGVVVTPGVMDHADVRRRELLVPALRHAGADGIQRMADAVAAGANPLRFAAAPALRP